MKYLLAPDSFKEAASAQAVAESMRRGVAAGDPGAECRMMPLSDGGEGLTDALVQATGGELRSEHAHDALGRPIITRYGFLGEGGFGTSHDGENPRTAVVELAAASGIARLAKSQGKPVIAIGGKVTRDPNVTAALNEAGIVATFGIAPGPAALPELLADTERNVEATCAAIAGLLSVARECSSRPHQ